MAKKRTKRDYASWLSQQGLRAVRLIETAGRAVLYVEDVPKPKTRRRKRGRAMRLRS